MIISFLRQIVNLTAWVVALALMALCLLANYPFWQKDSQATPLVYALYTSLSRIGWALALAYVIYACVHGYGGPVNWFLSLSFWLPLSRLSYSIYILHFPVIFIIMASAQTPYYLTEFSAVRILSQLKLYPFVSYWSNNILSLSLIGFAVSCILGQLCVHHSRFYHHDVGIRVANCDYRKNYIRRWKETGTV